MARFLDIFADVTKEGHKIPKESYLPSGQYPIIDQGQDDIAGYWDDEAGLYSEAPSIIFGDHTRIIKYVDTPCFLGADGVKLLKPILPNTNCKYLYYALCAAKIPNKGYNRHFKWLKEVDIPIPALENQAQIVDVLDKVCDLISHRKQQLAKLDELVKARFVEMFGDPIRNERQWDRFALGKCCKVITGNTPPRADSDNYGDFLEWIKSDNINTPSVYLTKAQEYLSPKGVQLGRYVESGNILMTCIAGSISCIGNVAITDRRVAFNQQINAIVPEIDNVWYLYYMFLLSKPYIHSTINMALKGILSKGQLEQIVFPFPPKPKQLEFAQFAEKNSHQELTIQQSLDKLEVLKKALMQEYFG